MFVLRVKCLNHLIEKKENFSIAVVGKLKYSEKPEINFELPIRI